ncbi:MAG: hypothetical protein HOP10_12325 [Chitinophagaceae bacterium]|nr:hypothetical protein [Chitinophagaceae bacterium]
MKRIQLIETGIIVVGLIFGYKFFEGIFSLLIQVFYGFQFGGEDIFETLLPTILMCAAYAICFVLLIRRSGQLATYLGKNMTGEQIAIKIGKKSLLQVTLIGICLATIIANIATILLYLFETFKNEVGRKSFIEERTTGVSGYTFKLTAIQTIVAIVTIYFSKDISAWFVRKNEVDELTFSSPDKE